MGNSQTHAFRIESQNIIGLLPGVTSTRWEMLPGFNGARLFVYLKSEKDQLRVMIWTISTADLESGLPPAIVLGGLLRAIRESEGVGNPDNRSF